MPKPTQTTREDIIRGADSLCRNALEKVRAARAMYVELGDKVKANAANDALRSLSICLGYALVWDADGWVH